MRAFSLIELIFVIVLIGILTTLALPRFFNLSTHSKETALKTTISAVLNSIENIHAKWIVNDNYNWQNKSCSLNENGYPDKLDENNNKMFECVLKMPPKRCGNNKNGCFDEGNQNEYYFYFDNNSYIRFDYNSSNGEIVCKDGSPNYSKSKCEEILFQ